MDQSTVLTTIEEADYFRLAEESSASCIELLRDLVTLPSPSRGERLACERVLREMETLGYQDVHLDDMGNVLGRIGSGPRTIAFDAHVDTVGISNPTHWRYDPFRGVISGGTLYGRGASDQKGGLAAMLHGLSQAGRLGLSDDLTVWAVASVTGEDCVGQAWQYLIREGGLDPEAVVIAMPSHLGVCRGQRGRMEVEIATEGVSTHCSHPERGDNAVYSMAEIVLALRSLHARMSAEKPSHESGSVAVTAISSESPSHTAIPDGAMIHVDRRLTLGESADEAIAELAALPEVQHSGASVRLIHYDAPSWRGLTYPVEKVFPAWETPEDSRAFLAAMATARSVLGREPRRHRSAFSSNGCVTAGMFGIPTIGFGPADEVHSHTVNDQIPLAQLQPAMAFFAMFPELYVRS